MAATQFPIGDIGGVYGAMERAPAERAGQEAYSRDGRSVALRVRVAAARAPALERALADASSGRVVVIDP